jgi:hypothetical protein
MNGLKRRLATVGVVVAAALVTAAPSFAAPAYPLSGVASGIVDELTNAVTTALPIGGPIVALFVGWRVLKRLVGGGDGFYREDEDGSWSYDDDADPSDWGHD